MPGQAASGVSATDPDVQVSVSPVCTVRDAVRTSEARNVPAVEASHSEKWVTVSGLVPAHDAQTGKVACSAHEPADEAACIGDVVREVLHQAVARVIVVDNGSTDATAFAANSADADNADWNRSGGMSFPSLAAYRDRLTRLTNEVLVTMR